MDVSPSGFYDYVERLERGHENQEEQALILRVKAIHERTGGVYGSRRMAREPEADGVEAGRYRARSLMRKAGIEVRRKKRFRVTTDSRHDHPVAPDRLDRRFAVTAPNTVRGGDITYLWTNQGWMYPAVIPDLFSRRVVGWTLADHMRAELAGNALRMAPGRRQPRPGLIHHSDRGSRYACQEYQALLQEYGLIASMSRKGNCRDNAPVERFFGSLKRERTDLRLYATREELGADVIDYIEMFYNSCRQHSYLDYTNPMEFEAQANVA